MMVFEFVALQVTFGHMAVVVAQDRACVLLRVVYDVMSTGISAVSLRAKGEV